MPFEVGRVIDHYRVDHVVHTGRFTVVYAATDLSLGRKSALKVLSDHYAPDPNFRERFAREVQVAASLDAHPNMVTVYGSGEADGTLFLATQFVEGVTLEELLGQQPGGEPLPPVEALEYLHQIASALDYAHSHEFVHRDVKPANVLISLVETPHRAFLVDFGVTKDIADNAKATQHGLFLGTAEYASPEQIHGAELDARSDVYSLACTAFELLTGSSPFAPGRDDAALIAAHLQAPIPSAAERRPTVPDAVDRVLAGGLSKDAAGRPASAGDFVQALNDAFAESTVLFERPAIRTAEEPPPADARRRWWIPAAIATAAVALIVAGVLVVRSFGGGDDAAPATTELASTTLAPTSTPLHRSRAHRRPDVAAGAPRRDRPRVRRLRAAGRGLASRRPRRQLGPAHRRCHVRVDRRAAAPARFDGSRRAARADRRCRRRVPGRLVRGPDGPARERWVDGLPAGCGRVPGVWGRRSDVGAGDRRGPGRRAGARLRAASGAGNGEHRLSRSRGRGGVPGRRPAGGRAGRARRSRHRRRCRRRTPSWSSTGRRGSRRHRAIGWWTRPPALRS